MRHLLQLLLGVILVSFSACSEFSRLQKSTDTQEKFAGAQKYYDKKDYYRASVLLDEVIPVLRGTDQAEKAHYLFAWSHYKMRMMSLSSYYFKHFTETFPRSVFAEEANYMYCLSLYEDSPSYTLDQTNSLSAIDAFQNFLMHYPNYAQKDKVNEMVDKLRGKLEKKGFESARLYQKMGDFKAAILAFENFKNEFPDSPLQEEAAYHKFETAFDYANNSVEHKKLERFQASLIHYQKFVDSWPNSRLLRSAERMFETATNKIEKLSKQPIQAHAPIN